MPVHACLVPEMDNKHIYYFTFSRMALNSSMVLQMSSYVSPSHSGTVANSALSSFSKICASAISSFLHLDAIRDIALEGRREYGEKVVRSAAINFCNLRI